MGAACIRHERPWGGGYFASCAAVLSPPRASHAPPQTVVLPPRAPRPPRLCHHPPRKGGTHACHTHNTINDHINQH